MDFMEDNFKYIDIHSHILSEIDDGGQEFRGIAIDNG
jgi:hypothetical protein